MFLTMPSSRKITLEGHSISTTLMFRLPSAFRSLNFRERRERGNPHQAQVLGKAEEALLLLFPRDSHLCKGIMLQLQGEREAWVEFGD
jgi:hypothetical protein